MELVDKRNQFSEEVKEKIRKKSNKSEILKSAKNLEQYIKKFKLLISDILKKDFKILFMVTTVKHDVDMRRKGYQSKKRGFLIDGKDYYVPNYYANQKDKSAQYVDVERYMIEDQFEINSKISQL